MPTFPTYRGELPECLNPLNLRHYFLLFYWIFFRPTTLESYLYKAKPKLYRPNFNLTEQSLENLRKEGIPDEILKGLQSLKDKEFTRENKFIVAVEEQIGREQTVRYKKLILKHAKMGFLHTWSVPAYRNLYVMMSVISILFSVLLGLPFTLLLGWNKSIPIDWLLWITGMTAGVVLGVGFGVGFGIILCLRNDLAASVAFSTVLGVFCGMASSVWMGATAGIAFSGEFRGAFDVPLGVTTGLMFGVGAAVIAIMAITSAYNWKVGVPVGLGCGIGVSLGVGGVSGIGGAIGVEAGFGVAFGLAAGVVSSVLIGMALSAVARVRGSFVLGITSSLIIGVMSSLMFDAATGLSLCIGVLRLVFYPFQLVLALSNGLWRIKHPLEWDEQMVFPLLNTSKVLIQRLQQDEKKGLHFLADIGRNPFQRFAMQKALYRYLHDHAYPIRFFYTLLTDSDFEEYAITPTKQKHWEHNVAVYRLFLGELALQLVIPKKGTLSSFSENLARWISSPLREHCRTPLTNFARMLCDLFDETTVEAENFELSSYAEIYNSLVEYSGGQEIAKTFDVMAAFLSYNSLSNFTEAVDTSTSLAFDDAIRPTVLTTLNRLGEVGAEVKTYQDSTSRANRMAALARATDALKTLDEYVQVEVMVPEQYLLQQIIRQWQDVLIPASGKLGRAEELGPVVNPYIAGNPVSGELFVGREDILRRLEELWSGEGQKPSVVLYGHRRMGKSSILHNLGTRFGQNTEIIDFNMQRAGLVSSTGELLYNLALTVYDALPTPHPSQEGNRSFSEPEEKNFLAHNPYTAFDRFLKQVDRIRGEKRFIITIDEFEMIEQRIQRGNLEPLLLDFWRGLIQTYPWIIMAFAGLHTLQEMTQDYWNPLFGSVTGIPVSFLKENAAKRLITQPSADFALDYDQDAISEIIRFTYGQPYLVQLICHCLVSLFNRQTFEEGMERERRFHRSDVEAVINAPEFFRDGEAYFSGVWQQAQHDDTPEAYAILKVLAQAEAGLSIEHLAKQSGLALEKVQPVLKFLKRHDMVTETADNWKFTVELMRRWVLHSK